MAPTTPRTWTDGELVTASIMNAHVRDNFNYVLNERPFGEYNTWAGGFTTTSTSFTDVTSATATVTSYGARYLVLCFGTLSNNTNSTVGFLDIAIDGTRQGDATNGQQRIGTINNTTVYTFGLCWITAVLAAGSRTIKIQTKTSAGTLSIPQIGFTVKELG